MYEYINGKITEATPTYIVVEAAGVGYFLNISLYTHKALEGKEEAKVYVHYAVREDSQVFFGFATETERELFRMLIGVSGVGGNTARMILSTYSVDELRSIIATGNATLLKNVKGLGLKTAQKIIVDLSGKMLELKDSQAVEKALSVPQNNESLSEALAALTMLGFQKTASDKVLQKIFKENPSISVEDAIRTALKHL